MNFKPIFWRFLPFANKHTSKSRVFALGKNDCGTGDKYVDYWLKDRQSGQGHMCYVSGEEYSGSWKEGKRFGFGVYHYLDGSTYTGEWLDGKRHGRGEITKDAKVIYSGMWSECYLVPLLKS